MKFRFFSLTIGIAIFSVAIISAQKPTPPQIAILSLAGGEARIITDLPKGGAKPIWSPDSKRITFLSNTTSEDIEKAKKKTSDKSGKPGEAAAKDSADGDHESDVHIV